MIPAAVPAIDEEPQPEDCDQHGGDHGQPPARRLLRLSSGLPKQAILQMWARALECAGVSAERGKGAGEFLVNPFILPGEDMPQFWRGRTCYLPQQQGLRTVMHPIDAVVHFDLLQVLGRPLRYVASVVLECGEHAGCELSFGNTFTRRIGLLLQVL